MPFDVESLRPAFEAYILTERTSSYLQRTDSRCDPTRDYTNLFVQEGWEAWIAAKKDPGPPLPLPSHVHCETCEKTLCSGIRVREALPQTGPSPEAILRARAEGRAEACNLLIAQDAETFCAEDKFIGDHAIADTGDFGMHWNEEAVRDLLRVDDIAYSEIDQLEASYWTQQAFIDGLQLQLSNEWLPIGAAESDKEDGRYILGWFPDRPRGAKINPDDPPEPWVAALRWSGKYELWGFLGVGGLMPTKFKPITGPDGRPIGTRIAA